MDEYLNYHLHLHVCDNKGLLDMFVIENLREEEVENFYVFGGKPYSLAELLDLYLPF